MVEFRTLGTCALSIEGRALPQLATQKARALLAYLIANRSRNSSRDSLIELFWPESDVERARKSLNTALWSIRKSLREGGVDPDAYLSAGKLAVRWTGEVWYDAETFESARTRELYCGDFLEGDYEEWTVGERERLAAIFESTLGASLESDRSPEAARMLLARDPFEVRAYQILIAHELHVGRTNAAESLLDRAREALAEIDTTLVAALEQEFAGAIAQAHRPHRELRLPFTGRRAEIDAFLRNLERGAPYAPVAVVGIAGCGKSMLLEQLVRVARGRGRQAVVVDVPEDDGRSFGVWERLFEQRCGEPFAQFVQSSGQAVGIALADRVASTFDSQTMLIVENVQFLRGEAFEVFSRLCRCIREFDVALVASTRPEGREALRNVLSTTPHVEWNLGSLTCDELAGALESLGVSNHPALAQALFARSEGHAFFVSRLLEFFVERGALVSDGMVWRYDARLAETTDVPDEVRRFVETRLRGCGDDAVSVSAALALDTQADADLLAMVSELGEERTYDALDTLLARGFLIAPDAGPQFAFSHDLIRETAVTLLSPARRARLHRRFGEAISTLEERGSAARRARHLAAARQYALACHHYETAAFEAVAWHAFVDAERLLRDALGAAAHLAQGDERERLMNIFKRLLSYALLRKHSPEAVGFASEAIEHAKRIGDAKLEMFGYSSRAQAFGFAMQDWHAMLEDVERLDALSVAPQGAVGRGIARILRAHANFELGRLDEAITACDDAYRQGVDIDRLDISATALQYKARFLASAHHFGPAFDALALARDAAARDGRIAQALWYFFASFVGNLADRFDDSRQAASKAIELSGQVTNEQLRTTRLHTPPDQTEYIARTMLVDLACVQQQPDEAAHEVAALVRLPYAELNPETRAVTAMLRARTGARVDPVLLRASKPFDVWHLSRQPWMEDPEARERAIDHLIERCAVIPADGDRVLTQLGEEAMASHQVALAARAQKAAAGLRASREAAISALGGRPLPI